jgi:hypothetical protein
LAGRRGRSSSLIVRAKIWPAFLGVFFANACWCDTMLKKVKRRAEKLGFGGGAAATTSSAFTYQFTVHVHSAEFVVHDRKWCVCACVRACVRARQHRTGRTGTY